MMILIRAFSPTDMPSIVKIVSESLGETYPPSLYLTIHSLWREGFLVILEDDHIVGFVAAVPAGGKVARILMLAISPVYRRRSLGIKLMIELNSSCIQREIDTVILEVRKSNRSAISFYESQGFTVCGEIREFYSNGEDAYKMMRVLQT
jgi:ribosomal-protein-alanine N-acetyltransferase